MPLPARQSILPFLLVAGSASALVAWNSFRVVQTVRQASAGKPADSLAAGTRLDLPAAEVGRLLGDRPAPGAPPVEARQTELALRAFHSCNARTQHGSTFKSLAAATPSLAEPLAKADSSLASACAMKSRFSRALSTANRAAAGAELQSHLSLALEAIESAQVLLQAAEPAPPATAKEQPGALRDPLIGLVGGLTCLLFIRRPRNVPVDGAPGDTAASIVDRGLPATLEPATYLDTVLHLLDDSGSFFFTEVFDRTPVPLVLLDGDGRIVRLNAEAESLAGRSTDELRRQFYWDVLVPESSREFVQGRFPLPEEAGPVAEIWISRQGVERTLFWSRALFLEGGSGKAALVLLAGQPVLSALPPPGPSSGVEAAAHELENELTLIGGHCELLLAGGRPSTGESEADLQHLREAVERAIHTVRRLLGGLPGVDRQPASFKE